MSNFKKEGTIANPRSIRLYRYQEEHLEKLAKERGVDFAYLIRYAVDLFLDHFLTEKQPKKKERKKKERE